GRAHDVGEGGAHGLDVEAAEDRARELQDGAQPPDGDAHVVDGFVVGRFEHARHRGRERDVELAELSREERRGGAVHARWTLATVSGLYPSARAIARRTARRAASAIASSAAPAPSCPIAERTSARASSRIRAST